MMIDLASQERPATGFGVRPHLVVRSMQTRQVRVFLAVMETGSIRAAARRLGISQPALTKTIKDLERELGVSLITRSAQGSVATEYGKAFYARAKTIDEELRRAKEEIDQMVDAKSGLVSIGMSANASLLLASEVVGRFRKSHAHVRIRVIDGLFENLLAEVRQGRVDFSIGGLPPSESGLHLQAERLFDHALVPVVRKGHPLAHARSLAKLANSEWVLTNDEPAFLDMITRHFVKFDLRPPRVALTCQSFTALLEILGKSDLIAVLPQSVLSNRSMSDHFIQIRTAEHPPVTTVALVRKAGVPLTPLAESLAKEFRMVARRLARSHCFAQSAAHS